MPPAGAWPFVTQAVCVALGALLITRMALRPVVRPAERTRVWSDLVEASGGPGATVRFRALTLTVVSFNVTYGAAWSVLVAYSDQRLHVQDLGFGLLPTAGAIGGALGIGSYDWLARRVRLGTIMRVGLTIETFVYLVFALNTIPWVAMAVLLVFGAHEYIWATTSRTVRMRTVPMELQGRVGSVSMFAVFCGMVIGQAVGGLIARAWGVTGPFWYAFVGSAIILTLIWRQLALIGHADEAAVASGD